MKTLSNTLSAFNKSVKHLAIATTNRKELWKEVRPQLDAMRNAYRTHTRLWLAEQLAADAPIDYTPLVSVYADMVRVYMEAEASTGLSAIEAFRPALFDMGVRGLDGRLTFIEVHTINGAENELSGEETGLRGILRAMPSSELDFFVRRTLMEGLAPMIPDALNAITRALDEMHMYGFDRESSTVTKLPAIDAIKRMAEARAKGSPTRPPRKGAANVLTKEVKAIGIVGSVGALCNVVLGVYSQAQYWMERQMESVREQLESAYLLHTGGETILVQSKDGERKGMHTGRDTSADLLERLVALHQKNEDDFTDFMAEVSEIMTPFFIKETSVPLVWGEGGIVTRTVEQSSLALAESVIRYRAWAEDPARIEYNHDRRVAVQLAAAEKVAKSFNKEDMIAKLMG